MRARGHHRAHKPSELQPPLPPPLVNRAADHRREQEGGATAAQGRAPENLTQDSITSALLFDTTMQMSTYWIL